jgi:thiol-disulfide isomerase/thioredoxin/Flp pilus assembly protein TadD
LIAHTRIFGKLRHFELQSRNMRRQTIVMWLLFGLIFVGDVRARQTQTSSGSVTAKSPVKQEKKAQPAPTSGSPNTPSDPQEPQQGSGDPGAELQIAVQQAGNDHEALIRNLEAYLARYPDSPRRVPIYRALAQSEMQVHNQKRALEYAEKVVAIQPDDSQTMYLAAMILEKMPDEASQNHAIDYETRLIERVAKADPESRPQQMTLDDWQAGRKKFTTELYVLRGRSERHLSKNEEAVKDLTAGFQLQPSADAAMNLGEIAEQEKRTDEAIRQYAFAFILAGEDPDTAALNQNAMRLRMGNLWRFTHTSNAGLGDILLGAFDKNKEISKTEQIDAPEYNKGLSDPLQFSMRQVDGKGAAKLADAHGKIVILNFWTSWCAYCRTMEKLLGDVRANLGNHDDVITLAANADEDGTLAAPFLEDQRVEGTVVFADGLERALQIDSIPTIIVLDRAGKIVYRTQGYAPDGFVDAASGAIAKALASK